MNYLDLFSGIGGFHKGLEEAGVKIDWCGFSDIEKNAISVYQKHFKESEALGDVTAIDVRGLPQIDLVTFGFPCQDLSIAGKRTGLEGRRSGLFYRAVEIIEATRPDVFVFENVQGLFSSNGGRDFVEVLRTISELGIYECQWQLLNTAWFLPQNRERVYFVGHLRGRGSRQVFPIGEDDEKSGGKARQLVTQSPCIRSEHHNTADVHFIPTEGKRIRRLTPKECERLQGFPDDWTLYGHDGKRMSDSARYKMIGNAVSVPVVKAVMERIFKNATETINV